MYYHEGLLLFLFLVSFMVISCRQEGTTNVTEPGFFTSGVEGPAVDHEGNLYAVNYEKQGTIGKISPDGFSELFVKLPEGSIGNGIRFDSQGKGTVLILSPEGGVLKEIEVKGKKVANIAFGGTDGKSCFVTVADRS